MKTIEVTDTQYAYIEQLRGELQEQVVGRYGTCLDRHAIQFLIDNIDEELDLGETFDTDALVDDEHLHLEEVDSDTDGSAESRDDTDVEGEELRFDETGMGQDSSDRSSGDVDGDAMLDRMMNLLDTHDDSWRESPSSDYRYRVDLPNGGTEDVQTKDDVRAILFREYR